MGKNYKKKSKFWKVVKIIGIVIVGIIAIIVGLAIYSNETAKNSQIKPLDYQISQSSTVILNYRYKYTNDDLLLAIGDIDADVESIIYSDIQYRKLGGYEVIYSSPESNYQLTVLISEISSKVHMMSISFIDNDANRKIYLRNNCDLTGYELAETVVGTNAITGFQIISDDDYFVSNQSGEFEINLTWSSKAIANAKSRVTLVRGVIKNEDHFYQGFIEWLLKQRKWIRRDLKIDI